MKRQTTERPSLAFEALECRNLQSGFAAPAYTPLPQTTNLLPYIEQENLRVTIGQDRNPGGGNQIIAILIG